MTTSSSSAGRSAKVRARRRQAQRPARRKASRRRVARAAGVPPIMIRGDRLGDFVAQRRKARTRRRFNVSLGVTGAELRLPAVPAVRLDWRLASLVLVALFGGLLYTVWNSPTYRVRAAQVEGVQRLTSHDINTVIKVAGLSIFEVAPGRIERELEQAFPELYDIEVQAGFPAAVLVQVKERQPVLTWRQDGMELWVDEQGVAFPPRGELDVGVTVEAVGAVNRVAKDVEATEAFISPDLLQAILTLKQGAPDGTPILYDAEHGLGWNDSRGWQVYFGLNAEDMDIRLQLYRAMVKKLRRLEPRPTLISVEHLHAPYYRVDR